MSKPSSHVQVVVNVQEIISAAESLRKQTRVDVIAVVKANAYGLGAAMVSRALADVVQGFYVFEPAEAVAAGLKGLGKPVMSMHHMGVTPAELIELGIRPCVFSYDDARTYAPARPILSVDVGMHRFGCVAEACRKILTEKLCDEALAHSTQPVHVSRLRDVVDPFGVRRHAAATALLNDPTAWLDAVRPGLALYENALRVSARLSGVTNTTGPAGYSGFAAQRVGIVLAGYSHGLKCGPVRVNGQPRLIREVGMQSAFVELGPEDKNGDEVVLLGDDLAAAEVAKAWGVGVHETILRMANMGHKSYLHSS